MLQPTSSADEIAEHLGRIPPFAIFVSQDLLPLGQEAVRRSPLSSELPFYRLSVPDQDSAKIPCLDDLIAATKELPPMQKVPLSTNDATRRVAYYCTTSGTSGFQVISHNPPRTILD